MIIPGLQMYFIEKTDQSMLFYITKHFEHSTNSSLCSVVTSPGRSEYILPK